MSDATRLPPPPAGRADLAFRAATLFERIAQAPAGRVGEPSRDARHIVELWQRTYSPGSWVAFTNRLSWDGFTTDGVMAALSASPAPAGEATGDAWIDWLQQYVAECHAHADHRLRTTVLFDNEEAAPRFTELLLPAWTVATRELDARLTAEARTAFGGRTRAAFGRRLVQDLAAQALHAFELRFATDATHQTHEPFVDAMLRGGLEDLLHDFPVLARHLALVAEQWVVTTHELMERFVRDRALIGGTFLGGVDPGDVVDVEPAMSDPHQGRRRVARLECAGGLRLIYKPRDIGIEAAFSSFLNALRERGLTSAPPPIVTLTRDGYGWVEHVTAASSERVDSPEWFRRSGALLCIAHVLRGRDLHMENVIASADGPVLVDVELLVQPVTHKEQQVRRAAAHAHGELQQSCLATGFLSDIQTQADGTLVDVGGLQGRVPQSRRTDFVHGFESAYRFLLEQRSALLEKEGPLGVFSGAWTRVIGRPTDQYASLLALLAAPKYQESGAQRSTAVDALNRAFSMSESRPALWPLTADERRSLERLDIPLFHAATDARHVYCEGRQVLANHFAQSGLEAVRERVAGLSEPDLQHQLSILRRATRESVDSRFTTDLVVAGTDGIEPSLGTRVVGHALWIAEECLSREAELAEDRGDAAKDFVLYDGQLGLALFHAAVAATAGSELSASAAREIVDRFSRSDAFDVADRPLGACTGDGSLLYTLTCIAALLEDERPLELALRVAHTITPARVHRDELFDVSSGSAGAILGLLALHARTGETTLLERAARCGDRLLATQVSHNGAAWRAADGRLYLGFAHGAAGIGFALVRLSRATGRQDFLEAAGAAHRFERRGYLPDQRNWPVAAPEPGAGVEMMTAWCHGAPGIALARAQAAVALRDRSLVNGLEAPLKTTASVPVRLDDHLCCGSMGRCDVLLTTGLVLRADQAVSAAWKLAGDVIDRAERERRYRLTSRGHQVRVFDAGFFRGLPGIGYQLLRLAAPSRLPSVLSFDVPSQSSRS